MALCIALAVAACGEGTPYPPRAKAAPNIITAGAEDADGILVKFRSSVSAGGRARMMRSIGAREVGSYALVPNLSRAVVEPGQTVVQALQQLQGNPDVIYAEPNYIIRLDQMPNDGRFSEQWGMHNSAQTGGRNDADVDAPEVWDVQTGQGVVIAVIDTGVDYNHADLSGNIWVNEGEIPNNRRDDDGNGFVDDVRGWDFNSNDNDPLDDNNHGTHVAGVIGARGNNGTGIAGLNWNARIMPLKFMNANGAGSTAAAISALEYAVANGAKVSNNSWGGPAFSQALFDAIQAANGRGHIFVAAAGNDGTNNDNTPHYPSNYNLPNIISVAASDSNDALATFSNFGVRTVDLAAPGVSIVSTVRNNQYASFSGTSMAAPFVTGVVGLLFSQNPLLPVAEIRNALNSQVDAVGSFSGRVISGGRLNAFASVNSVANAAPTQPVNPTPNPAPGNPGVTPSSVTLAPGDTQQFSASGGTPPYRWRVNNSSVGSISANGLFTASGAGSVAVTVADANNAVSSAAIVTVTQLSISPAGVSEISASQTLNLTASGGTAPYQWSSSNTLVAELVAGASSASAQLRPLAAGSTTVTLQDSAGNSDSRVISITPVAVAPLNIQPVSSSITLGGSQTLTLNGGTSPYSWSSSNPQVARVDSGGLVTGLAAGRVSVTARDADGATATASVSVLDPAVSTLLVSPSQAILSDSGVQLKPSGGTPGYLWDSTNVAVAQVSRYGFVRPVSPGTATINVIDMDGNTGTVAITVTTPAAPATATPGTTTPSTSPVTTTPGITSPTQPSSGDDD